MLAETLIPRLEERFSGRPIVIGTGSQPTATFPAVHPDVDDLIVQDDGDELTIYVGRFTHVHLGNYDEGVTENEREQRIVEETLAFLDDIFADRIEFFASRFGSGGCRKRDGKPRGVVSKLLLGPRSYVWSGPLGG